MLDTSVLITAFRSSSGAAAEIVRLALVKEMTILLDYKLAGEYRDVALRSEHLKASGRTQKETELLIDMLEAVAEPFFVAVRHAPLSQDANDDMPLEPAINGGADEVVTNNTRRFREAARDFDLQLLTPTELLNEFRARR